MDYKQTKPNYYCLLLKYLVFHQCPLVSVSVLYWPLVKQIKITFKKPNPSVLYLLRQVLRPRSYLQDQYLP